MFAGASVGPALRAMGEAGVTPLVLPELAATPLPDDATLLRWQRAASPVRGLAVLGGLALDAALGEAEARALGERLRTAQTGRWLKTI